MCQSFWAAAISKTNSNWSEDSCINNIIWFWRIYCHNRTCGYKYMYFSRSLSLSLWECNNGSNRTAEISVVATLANLQCNCIGNCSHHGLLLYVAFACSLSLLIPSSTHTNKRWKIAVSSQRKRGSFRLFFLFVFGLVG